MECLFLPFARVGRVLFTELSLRGDHRHVCFYELVDSWQQEIGGVFNPSLLRVGDDEDFGKLNHLVKKCQQFFLHLDEHSHVFPRHLLKICGFLATVFTQKERSWKHSIVPVKNYYVLMRFLLF